MRGSKHGGGCDVKKMKMELRESLLEERESESEVKDQMCES